MIVLKNDFFIINLKFTLWTFFYLTKPILKTSIMKHMLTL